MSDITEGAQVFQQGVQDLTSGFKAVEGRKAAKATAEKQAYVGSLLAETPEGQTGLGRVGTAAVGLGLAEPWQVAGDMMKMDPIKLMTMIGRDAFLKNDPKLKEAFNAMGAAFGRGLEIESFSKSKGAYLAKIKYGGGSGGGGDSDGGGPGGGKKITTRNVDPADGKLFWDKITQIMPEGKLTIQPYSIPGAVANEKTNKEIQIDFAKPLEPQLQKLSKEGYSQEQLNDINRYALTEITATTASTIKTFDKVFTNPAAANYLDAQSAVLAQKILTSGKDAFITTYTDERGNEKTTFSKIPLGDIDVRLYNANNFATDPELDAYRKRDYLKSIGVKDSLMEDMSAEDIVKFYDEVLAAQKPAFEFGSKNKKK